MPSPFPGMDPFIENQRWSDFHHGLFEEIRSVRCYRPAGGVRSAT